MAEVYLRRGRASEAIRSAQLALGLDDLRESSWRLLMQAHAIEGNVGKALDAYDRCRRTLRGRLGAVPSPATRATHQALLGY